ncbi:MAG: tRNA glutamyl-Q(34) synthetase GluQRS [Micrococcales bacterium]|nr:MAG: tRNA glutamyl-Q(34) synthetase GluQRS [Micrococcales bacterium]
MSPPAGRYAPSPSGDLHVGNLRTALLAWLFARSQGRPFRMRMEDLDRVEPGAAQRQLGDLRALGLDWDEPVMWQSDRLDTYQTVLAELTAQGRTYECFCSRRDILEAPSAPHAPPGAYPGTCRDLNSRQRADRARTRPAALRLRAGVREAEVVDDYAGHYRAMVDDLVLRRNDGIPAYNLVVVVDDDAQQVGQVVRGDDLLASAPRQAYLAGVLGLPVPRYAHVPMAVNRDGVRLAKRDGAVTMADLAPLGWTPATVLSLLARSAGLAGAGEPVDAPALLARFDPALIPREPWVVDTTALAGSP